MATTNIAPARDVTQPVTVVVTRRVKPGKEPAYEAWLERLIREASALPGYLGTNVLRPAATGSREYTSVFRFDSVEHLRAFEDGSSHGARDRTARACPHRGADTRSTAGLIPLG